MAKNKEEYISFRATAAEKKKFKKIATAQGLNLSTYIRFVLLKETRKVESEQQ